jgi:DNA polymerase III epsilon subunit-like protein
VRDDEIKQKLIGAASQKDAKLETAPKSAAQEKNKNSKEPEKDKPEKPSKAKSEFEQFLIDWEPGDPLPFFPPGKILRLCHLSNNPMVTGSDYYFDNPKTTIKPYRPGQKSIEEEFIEVKNLGPKLKEGLSSLLGMVARSRGLWVDDKNKLRCPAGTPNANQFTDITGSNCFIPTPATAAQSGARAARRVLGTAEQMAAGVGQRVDRSTSGRAATAQRWTTGDLAYLQQGMDFGGRMGMPGSRVSPSQRTTRAGRVSPATGSSIYYIGRREAIARGKDLTRAARDLSDRYKVGAQTQAAIRLPNGQLVGNVLNRADFMAAMTYLMPNVDPNEIEEYYSNAIPGTLSLTDRRKYQSGFKAFWEAHIFEMIENAEAYKLITKFEMMDDLNTAIEISVEPFGPSPLSGGRRAGIGATQMATQANLMAEGGAHVSFKVSPFGMWQQMNGVGRNMDSDGSGWLDSIEGRMHYVAVHEAGHTVDFYNKLKAFGLDPNSMQRYTAPRRVVSVGGSPTVQQDKYNGAWIIDWANVTNPQNNPFVDDMIDAARRLKNTSYTGSKFSGRKIDLQNDLTTFYDNLAWAFQNNITHDVGDLVIMAAAVGGEYATVNGVETSAEFYAWRRLFGELRGNAAASRMPIGRDILQEGPFDLTPSDIDLRTTNARNSPTANLLTHFAAAWAVQERDRAMQPGGALDQIQQQLPPGVGLPQSIIDNFEQNAAADAVARLNQVGQSSFGVSPTGWNISGRMGNMQGPNDRPQTLHARRVRNAVRSYDANKTRVKTSFSISGRMGTPDPVKPQRPREPDNGPFTGKFLDVLRGASTWKEFASKYRKQTVVFFDYETTGFGDDGNMPVQIGAVKMRGGKVVERFNVFVNPGIPLGDWAKKNLKNDKGEPLTDEWLASKAGMRQAHEQLLEFFGEDALLGGQYTPFDLEVLERILKQEGIDYKPAGVIDSKAMADELLPRWSPQNPDGPTMVDPKTGEKKASNSLGPLAEYLEVDLGDGWHTADADSEASAMIIEKMLDRAASKQDTSKRLLDVDQVPRIVQERRAKYERDMADYQKAKAEYDQLISGRMGVVQFETANGSVYTRQADGRFRRRKSAVLGTTIEDSDVESTFDNTVFVNDNDAYAIMAKGQRGRIVDDSGNLIGRIYDDTNLDSSKFMSLRRDGDDFDTAYRKAGGTIKDEAIPAARIYREPQTGLAPIEWNNADNKYHVGSSVSSVTTEPSTSISGRMGNPERASKAKTAQVKEVLSTTKSSVGANMSDEYVDNWESIEPRLSGELGIRKPLKKAEARAQSSEAMRRFGSMLRDSIGNENKPAQQTPYSPLFAGVELDFMAHIGSMTDEEIENELVDAMTEFHAGLDPRPRVQVWQGDLTRILQHGYKTTHNITSDHSSSPMRKTYEAEIGIHPDFPDTMRPASGYMVHSDWLNAEETIASAAVEALPGADEETNFPEYMDRKGIEDHRGPVSVYGGAEIILRPETSGRTYYGYGDSLSMRFTPVSINSTDPDEIVRPMAMGGTIAGTNMFDLLYGKWKGDYSALRYQPNGKSGRHYFESMVVGGFDAADIEEVVIPNSGAIPVGVLFEPDNLPESRGNITGSDYDDMATIPAFAKMSDAQYWIDNAGSSEEQASEIVKMINDKKMLTVRANPQLARGLAAQKIKERLLEAGAKLTVRNQQGMDYFDPQSWVDDLKAKTLEDAIEMAMRNKVMRAISQAMKEAQR